VRIPLWLAQWTGLVAPPPWLLAAWGHAHEMLFGFAAAAIAGFLLTSVPVWTERPPLVGARLAGLAALWLAGRVAFALAGTLPAALVAALDLAFLPLLALAVAAPLLATRQRRNYGFPPLVLGLALANALVHAEALGLGLGLAQAGLRLGVDLVALLVALVGGRITPSFTQNALRREGDATVVLQRPWANFAGLAAVVLYAAADLLVPRTPASGALAALAAATLAVRMSGWRTWRTRRDPLVWSLHAGYTWLVVGFACIAAGDLGAPLFWTAGVHALTAGAFGAMILAVATRVALGHTGRPLVAPPGIPLAYALVSLGALLRVLGPVVAPAWGVQLVVCGGLLWSAAFALFLAVYAPILLRPRLDERPG
jgi:uncharacterized protein involved in response to NO